MCFFTQTEKEVKPMKKSMILSLTVVALVLAFVLPNLYAVDVPGDDYMIPKPEGVEIKNKSLPFSHSKHGEYECTECHHTWDGAGEIQACTAAGCHDLYVAATPDDRKDIKFWEKAFHDQCIGCHRDLRKEQKPTGPVACTGCHPKE